jgi:hypothetical protein
LSACSEPEETDSSVSTVAELADRKANSEMNAERRKVIRDMLYRKDS